MRTTMKFILKTSLFLIISFSINLIAQDDDFKLENLKAPSMPSATIIGTQINDVNSPKSMKDLETAVFTNYLNSGESLTVPNNFALEINPFMIGGRKNFNYKSYLENNALPNMWQNLSISVASTSKFIISDTVSTNALGFSLRTIILNGEPQKKVSDAFIRALDNNQYVNDIKSKMRFLIKRCFNKPSFTYTIDNLRTCVIDEFRNSEMQDVAEDEAKEKQILIAHGVKIIKSVFAQMNRNTSQDDAIEEFDTIYKEIISKSVLGDLREKLREVKTDRFGLRWDLNWAMALNFPTDEFSYSVVPRWGVWTNLSYKSEDLESFTFIGLGRILINNDDYINKYQPSDGDFTAGNHYDFGAKIVYESDKFSLGIEYIYRLNTTKITKIIDGDEYKRTIENNSTKYVININYNLSDDINLSYNFGKNFDSISPTQGDLISGLSINFGFGSIKASELLANNE